MDVFNHPWLGGLFGDAQLGALIGPDAQLANMIMVEKAFTHALGQVGRVSPAIAGQAEQAITAASFDHAALRAATGVDGLVVPELIRQLRAQVPDDLAGAVHTGLTSQDVIDTALVLALRPVLDLFDERLIALGQALDELDAKFGHQPLMGRTRMQAAIAITVADRIATWRMPLHDHRDRLAQLQPRLLKLQLGGAAGNNAALGQNAPRIAAIMAERLNLGAPDKSWHAMRDGVAEFSGWLSLITGTLGKMGQDMGLMAQQGIDEIAFSGGGSSSAMAHKKNPVKAELLVTLARFNATQLGAMHHALVHEQERSGAAWALEWMVLPQMIMATGCALNTATQLVRGADRVGVATT